jgi:hypothetical protein
LKPWTDDILDQLAIARLLAHAGISCGERLALITTDNAVEYMCKAFVETKRLVHTVIKKAEWERTKHSFHELILFVSKQEPRIGPHVSNVESYHDVRNRLYHEGQPLSVKSTMVDQYLQEAYKLLDILLGVTETEDQTATRLRTLHSALLGLAAKEIRPGVQADIVNGVHVRLSSDVALKLPDAIWLTLYHFPRLIGHAPNIAELEASLILSGHSPTRKALHARLSEFRSKKLVKSDELTLTGKGRDRLLKKYLPA